MMINCPKCNFLQEKDQYCAQCGVNMQTWKKPKPPIWKRLLGNWMIQLTLLFVLILGVVLRDNLSSNKTENLNQSLPPVSQRIERDQTLETSSASANFTDANNNQKQQAAQKRGENDEKMAEAETAEPSLSASQPLEKLASIRVFSVNRAIIDRLFQEGRRVDDGIQVYSKERFRKFRKDNSSVFNRVGFKRKEFQLGQATNFFIGEVDNESGLSLGFFHEINVAENSRKDKINGEIRFWHQLKLSDEASAGASANFSITADETMVIIDPSVHDVQFTPEEIALLEGSAILEELATESFLDLSRDIALVIEIR